MVRYYGLYSNGSRKLRQRENRDTLIPSISLKKISDPPHLLLGRTVEFKR